MKQVTKIPASSLSRVMSGCIGSLSHEIERLEQTDAAKEGEAFHELLDTYVRVIGERGTHAKNGWPFDDEMHFYAKQLKDSIPMSFNSELKCSWQTQSGITISGRFDYAGEIDNGETLCIIDVKYGWKIVEAENNWQLIAYAIGEVIRRQKAYSKIQLCIMQPRPHHEKGSIRHVEISYEQLLHYMNQINEVAARIAAGDTTLMTSEHCKYCPAAASACAAINRAVYNSVDVVLNQAVQDSMTNQEISTLLFTFERIKDIIKVKTDAMSELAKSRLTKGELIPNYGLKASYGDRQWLPGVTPETIQMMCGVDITERKTLSPAQAEKKGVPKELMKQFAKAEVKGFNLVRQDSAAEANKIFNNK